MLANLTLAIPVMLLVTSAAMSRIPPELELAAMVAGASRLRAWLGITLRLLAPAIMAGTVLAFVASLDEAVLINFLGGPGLETLPKAILDSVRYGLEPVITAIATLLMVGTSLAMALGRDWRAGGLVNPPGVNASGKSSRMSARETVRAAENRSVERDTVLDIQALSKSYGETPALQEVELAGSPGRAVDAAWSQRLG